MDSDFSVAENLGIIRVTDVRDNDKCNIARIQSTGYKCRQILGISPLDKENDPEFRKNWAEKIIDYLNNEIKWKHENTFWFRADLTKTENGKLLSSLENCLLDEDISGFVGMYLYDDVCEIKNKEIMGCIFGNEEHIKLGENILLANWNSWAEEE